jgi:hypothetical protein
MVIDLLGSLLQELGQLIGVPNLQPDANNVCLIKFKGNVYIQLELDRSSQFLIMTSDLGSIPIGRYRETIFFEALKANGLPPPHNGIFGYSKQADRLILFQMLSIKDLTGNKISDALAPFLEKAKIWKSSIEKGEIPPVVLPGGATAPKGIFGLRP